jgi:hypothetical protein
MKNYKIFLLLPIGKTTGRDSPDLEQRFVLIACCLF